MNLFGFPFFAFLGFSAPTVIYWIVVGTAALSFGFVLSLPFAPWVLQHTDFITITRRHLQRFAPLYFVVGPPAVVYIAMCGPISFLGFLGLRSIQVHFLHHPFDTVQQMEQHGLVAVLTGSEYVCSFIGAFGFAWIFRWARLPRFWLVILVLSLCFSAAYRTARHEQGESGKLVTGPLILASPEWIDCLPVLLGTASIALLRRRSLAVGQGPNKAPEPTSPSVTSRADARVAPAGVVAHL